MGRNNKQNAPLTKSRTPEWLATAGTNNTNSMQSDQSGQPPTATQSQAVPIPNSDLFPNNPIKWDKIGVYVAVLVVGGTCLWNFADTYFSVKNLSDDVKDLKHKTDELTKSTIESATRLTSLERERVNTPVRHPATK